MIVSESIRIDDAQSNRSTCSSWGPVSSATPKGSRCASAVTSSRSATWTRRCSRSAGPRASRRSPMTGLDLVGVDVVLVSVSTPTSAGGIDLRHLEAAVATIGDALGRASSSEPGRYRVVIVRSTVPPGTTEDVVIPLLEAEAGLQAGLDFGVCMSPEYLRQRSAVSDSVAPRLVVIGQLDDRSGDVAERLNAGFGCPVYRVPIREAEFQKYAHNLTNASKISFFNELRRVAARHRRRRRAGVRARGAELRSHVERGVRHAGSGSVRGSMPARRISKRSCSGRIGKVWISRSCLPSGRATTPRKRGEPMPTLILIAWFTPVLCAAMILVGALRARIHRRRSRPPAPTPVDHPDHHRGERRDRERDHPQDPRVSARLPAQHLGRDRAWADGDYQGADELIVVPEGLPVPGVVQGTGARILTSAAGRTTTERLLRQGAVRGRRRRADQELHREGVPGANTTCARASPRRGTDTGASCRTWTTFERSTASTCARCSRGSAIRSTSTGRGSASEGPPSRP